MDGSQKLLWLFNNHINGGHGAFGPFPYQSNGAQFLNLNWPIMLGFWWLLFNQDRFTRSGLRRFSSGSHIVLIALIVLVASGVF